MKNTRNLAFDRLRDTARAVAERQRDPFVIAQHLLLAHTTNRDVVRMTADCDTALRISLSNYPPVTNIARTAADGTVRCSAIPLSKPVNFAREGWWRRGVNAKGMTITKAPVFGLISQRDVLFLILPLRTADGQSDGTITAAIDVKYLRDGLRQAARRSAGALAIVTRDGAKVASGDRPLPFTPDVTARQNQPVEIRDNKGTLWIYTLHKLYSSDLFVVYAEPRDTLMAAAVSQVRISILLPIISILLASLAIWVGTHRLALIWLRELRAVSGRFAQGDFTADRHKFDRAPEEIAAFSADLHSMADAIDRRNTDLTHALEAKTLLTREVHHRVKNNLQIINSLLTLQLGRAHEGAAKEVLAQTLARISALALIHRLLYEQDNGYERGEVPINNLMAELCAQLRGANRSMTHVQLTCQAESFPVPIEYAVPLTLFVVEAVTNAFRHAFPKGRHGAVILRFNLDGARAILDISDNGQGYVVSDAAAQMGTELMHGFATQVDGELSISSRTGSGTQVVLKFPLARVTT
ncbi:histidine kinase dimerization/phosphoacceptor domain -containing protein [Sphingorhabdus sp. EL138]|uniref:sensor histidine kinase n=1 Tax=Sphingorhabdus sp. EL138 TaxID=2073156 RepID=UPI0025F652E2|nr:histidine kinase dimerization/phosphoacceptor domain -containing protein [Sphingorhabdus sp. EL138]